MSCKKLKSNTFVGVVCCNTSLATIFKILDDNKQMLLARLRMFIAIS